MKDIGIIEAVKQIREKSEFLFWLMLIFGVFCLVVFATSSSAASAAEEDPRHQLCAEGKLPMLSGVGNVIDKTFFNPETEVLHRTDRLFYVETTKNGKNVEGCIPAGIPISAKKGNPFAEHFATKGWRMIHNFIPMPVVVPSVSMEKLKPSAEKVFLTENKPQPQPQPQPQKNLFLGLSDDIWRKLSYCAGSVAVGYGANSGNTGIIGGGVVIVGITLYFDGDKSLLDQFSWGDVGVGILCGTAGYYVAPKKEESSSSETRGGSSGSSGPSGPGPDPTL